MENNMRKQIIILSLIISSILAYKPLSSKTPEIIFRAPTQKEAFFYCANTIKTLDWLKEHGYDAPLPQHNNFKKFYSDPEKMTDSDITALEKVFNNEIYKTADFDEGLNKGLKDIHLNKNNLEKIFIKLEQLQNNWKFKLIPTYEILLSLYGPGAYDEPSPGQISIITTIDGSFKNSYGKPYLLHQLVRMILLTGIQENIVERYQLAHWEKIRLIDLICVTYLNDVIPGYRPDIRGEEGISIDKFISYDNILNDLPVAIEKFIKKHPRDPILNDFGP